MFFFGSAGPSSMNDPTLPHITVPRESLERWENTPPPHSNFWSPHIRSPPSDSSSSPLRPTINNLIDHLPNATSTPLTHPSHGPSPVHSFTVESTLADSPPDLSSIPQHPHPRPRPRMRPVPGSSTGVLTPNSESSALFQHAPPFASVQRTAPPINDPPPQTPRASPMVLHPHTAPRMPAQPPNFTRDLSLPARPNPAQTLPPALPPFGSYLPRRVVSPAHTIVSVSSDSVVELPRPHYSSLPTFHNLPTGHGMPLVPAPTARVERDTTPSTIIISDCESVSELETRSKGKEKEEGSTRPNTLCRTPKYTKALQPCYIPTEDECLRSLSSNRKGKMYQYWEDLRLVRYLVDHEHPNRIAEAQQKVKRGKLPTVFERMSKEVFLDSRDSKALYERWGVIKKTFSVVERLENATGGNGVADCVTDDPNQTVLEKLGMYLTQASKRIRIGNLKAPEYHAWIQDPPNGLYMLLSEFLLDDVSVVRSHQYCSGVVSPLQKNRTLTTLDEESDSESVQIISSDKPTAPNRGVSTTSSRSGSPAAAPSCADTRDQKSGANPSRSPNTFTSDFIESTKVYQEARAETDRRRLELEESRFQLERSNEERAEQRIQQENQRIELIREEHKSMEKIAQDSHDIERARLDLARDRNEDLKRKGELDELDRLRTHKRLRAETITNTALQIQGDKDDRFSAALKEASHDHILAMFAQARETD